jgi:hypothetical protein
MFLGVRPTPLSIAEFPFSPPFSKQNGGELTLGTVSERPIESAFRLTLAVPELWERCGKQQPHSSPISDFFRATRPGARPSQPCTGALDRSTRRARSKGIFHQETLTALQLSGLPAYALLRTWRPPSHA